MITRIGKTLLAISLVVVGAQELRSMWAQTHNISSLILCILMLAVPVGLLIRSIGRERQRDTPPSKAWQIFWGIVAAFMTMSLIGMVLISTRSPSEVVVVKNISIPLDRCIIGSKNMFATRGEAVSFCRCMAEKMANNTKVVDQHREDLVAGRLMEVLEDMKANGLDVSSYFTCLTVQPGPHWTDAMKDDFRRSCIERMLTKNTMTMPDAQRFCDCLTSKVTAMEPFQMSPDTPKQARMLWFRLECM